MAKRWCSLGFLLVFTFLAGLPGLLGAGPAAGLAHAGVVAAGPVLTATVAAAEASPPLDLALVFDVSLSMQYHTPCFGCWTKTNSSSYVYPANGAAHPLPDTTADPLCASAPAPFSPGDYQYLVHEAELYSRDAPLHGWEFARQGPGRSFWALQRQVNYGASGEAYVRAHPPVLYSQSDINNNPQLLGMAYNAECFNGPTLSGECWQTRAAAISQTVPAGPPPWLEYDFTPAWDGPTAVWIRAIGGMYVSRYAVEWNGPTPAANIAPYRVLTDYQRAIFWQVNGEDIQGGPLANLLLGDIDRPQNSSQWRWVKLGQATTASGVPATLKLYQGSAGLMVDKIIFTNDGQGNPGDVATTGVFNLNGGRGPAPTSGSATREACNRCNPVFGLAISPAECSCRLNAADTTVGDYPAGGTGQGCTMVLDPTNQLTNDLFSDTAYLRPAQEAAKRFAGRLDPHVDQLGFIGYSNPGVTDRPDKRAKLQCLRWAATNDPAGVARCYDPAASPISYTRVLQVAENQSAYGSTDLGYYVREGLEELGVSTPDNTGVDSACSPTFNDKHACDRGGAALRAIILTSDGGPSTTPSSSCPAEYAWQGRVGANQPAFNCAIYYAALAAAQHVPVFIIGIGPGADVDLLTAMATGADPGTGHVYFTPACGQFFPTANAAGLDGAFEAALAALRACAGQRPAPSLTIVKSAPPVVLAGRPFTYTLTVTNTGAISVSNLVITDAIPAGAAYMGGGTRVGNVVSWTVEALPGGTGLEVTFAVTATNTLTNNHYRVSAAGSYWATGDTAVVTRPEWPSLTITKSAPATVRAGRPFTYTLTITNNGSLALTGLVITDAIPAGAAYVGGGTRVGNVVSWTVGSLPGNASVKVTFVVTTTTALTNCYYQVSLGDYWVTGNKVVVTRPEIPLFLPVIPK